MVNILLKTQVVCAYLHTKKNTCYIYHCSFSLIIILSLSLKKEINNYSVSLIPILKWSDIFFDVILLSLTFFLESCLLVMLEHITCQLQKTNLELFLQKVLLVWISILLMPLKLISEPFLVVQECLLLINFLDDFQYFGTLPLLLHTISHYYELL